MYFAWDQRYEVGIESIDEQHQRLVAMLNELYQAYRSNQGTSAIGRLLHELQDYAEHHFRHEEQIMAGMARGKAWQERHVGEHDTFRQRLAAMKADYEAGAEVTLNLLAFLKHWLTQHILVTDRGLAQ